MQLWMLVAGGLALVLGAATVAAPDNPLVRAVLRPEADEWGAEWGSRERRGRVRSVGAVVAVGGLVLLVAGLVL